MKIEVKDGRRLIESVQITKQSDDFIIFFIETAEDYTYDEFSIYSFKKDDNGAILTLGHWGYIAQVIFRSERNLAQGIPQTIPEGVLVCLTLGEKLAEPIVVYEAEPKPEVIEKDSHTGHCCINHGCKYGDEDCTVTSGEKPQSYECLKGAWCGEFAYDYD